MSKQQPVLRAATWTATLLLILGPGAVHAVEQDAKDASIEEVIVTAQKRDQALRDVPMAVSAVTAEDIEAMGAVDLTNLQFAIPSLTISSLGGVAETMRIRAISPPGSLLPTVGRYVDEMGVNAETIGYGIDFPMVDLERVEVLKGPQGTLYGEGSIGGTVKFVTKNPTPGEVDGIFETSARAVHDGSEGIRAFVGGNLPIGSEAFGLRLVGFFEDTPGWVDNSFTGDDANSTQRWFLRAKAQWRPADTLTAELFYQHYENEVPGLSYSRLDYNSDYFIPSPNEVNYDILNLVFDWQVGNVQITSSTGYQHRAIFNSLDISGYKAIIERPPNGAIIGGRTDWAPLFGNEIIVPNPVTNIGYSLDQLVETFSQEVRANGQVGESLYFTLGAFYKDSKHDAPLFTQYHPDPNVDLPPALAGRLYITTESWAVFGELTAAVTEDLEAIVGVRYYEDERSSINITQVLLTSLTVDDGLNNNSTALRGVLKYNISEDIMAYASVSEGFRSGGVQFIDTEAFGIGPNTFDPEELITYETGVKGALADNALEFEAALFFSEYENVQVYVPNALGVQAFLNSGVAEVLGFELSAKWNLSESLFLHATYGLNDSEYTKPGITHDKGDPMDSVPEWTYSLALDYRFNWWGDVGGHLRIDWWAEDDKETNLKGFGYTTPTTFTEGYKALNARIGWEFGHWSLYAFGENLTNEDKELGVPFATLVEWVLEQPRTIGLTARAGF